MGMILFKSKDVEIWEKSRGKYAMAIYNKPRLAKRVNAILGRYDLEYGFSPEDEPLFFFSEAQIESIASAHKILKKILIQAFKGPRSIQGI